MSNIIQEYESRLRGLSQVVTSKNLPIEKRAQEELSFWRGKTETSSGARSRLATYWNHINFGSWSPSGTPWSAAFISYILRGQMQGSGSHYQYVKSAMEGKGGWRAISIPKNRGKISVSVGDVFVRPRSGSYTNSHGDVVYKISKGKAYLAGGNLSDTAQTLTLPLGNGQILQDGGRYLIVLKKKPKYARSALFNKILAYGGFSVALGLTGVLAYLVADRKGYIEKLKGSKSLRLVPDLKPREIIEHVVTNNWANPIESIHYEEKYDSPLKGGFVPGEALQFDPKTEDISPMPFDMDKAFFEVQNQNQPKALFFEFDNSQGNFNDQYYADNKIRSLLLNRGVKVTATSWTMPGKSGYPMQIYRVEWK